MIASDSGHVTCTCCWWTKYFLTLKLVTKNVLFATCTCVLALLQSYTGESCLDEIGFQLQEEAS